MNREKKDKCSEGGLCDYTYEYSSSEGDWYSCTKCSKKIIKRH